MKSLWIVTVACLLFAISPAAVRADGINVTVARYSERTPVGSFACCSAFANLTVAYSGSDHLVVGIKDSSTGEYLQGRVLFNYPYADIHTINCQVSNSGSETFCDVATVQSSGDLHLGFSFTASNRTGDWDLEAVALLADSDFNPIDSTLCVSAFTIRVYDMASVYVKAPEPVSLKLDGTSEGPGGFHVSLKLGSSHIFSVPLVQMINETSRLELSWFGGYGASDVAPPFAHNDSGYIHVSMHVLQDANLTADYVEEYRVFILNTAYNGTAAQSGLPKANPSDWYRQGTLVYIGTVSSPQPLQGFLGELGVREVFDGWYVNGQYLNDTSYVAVPVSGPLTVEARWHVDYTTVMIAIGTGVAVCLLGYATLSRIRSKLARRRNG